jgi:pyruvate/2-oxoglutarate/acetoin dehydrogenase E1 component
VSGPVTYGHAFAEGVSEEMRRDPSIMVIGTDLLERGGHFSQLKGVGAEFGPKRVRDAPISEAAMVAAGVGGALNGLRPLVDLNFADFLFGAMDEVVNQAAKLRYMTGVSVPLVIRMTGGVAFGGGQHNNCLEGWFASMPGLLVAVPATPADNKGLIKSALRGDDPVMFFMHKKLTGMRAAVGGEDDLVPFGHAAIRRTGTTITIVSYSYMVGPCLEAAERLAADGVEAEVIDLRTLMPLDLDTLEQSVRKTGRAMVVSDAPRFGSITAEIAASIQESMFEYLDAAIVRVGARHAPIPHSPGLIDALVPNVADIERIGRDLARRTL